MGFEERARVYKLILTFEDLKAIKYGFGIDENIIKFVTFHFPLLILCKFKLEIAKSFLPSLLMHIHKQLKKGHARDWEHKAKVVKTGI